MMRLTKLQGISWGEVADELKKSRIREKEKREAEKLEQELRAKLKKPPYTGPRRLRITCLADSEFGRKGDILIAKLDQFGWYIAGTNKRFARYELDEVRHQVQEL